MGRSVPEGEESHCRRGQRLLSPRLRRTNCPSGRQMLRLKIKQLLSTLNALKPLASATVALISEATIASTQLLRWPLFRLKLRPLWLIWLILLVQFPLIKRSKLWSLWAGGSGADRWAAACGSAPPPSPAAAGCRRRASGSAAPGPARDKHTRTMTYVIVAALTAHIYFCRVVAVKRLHVHEI